MNEAQLSLLSVELSAVDINAVDHGVLLDSQSVGRTASEALAARAVDDWVFGLGFTTWKTVIDHALRTGHFELFPSANGKLGLRKYGYRYAPIPILPHEGAAYVQQQLLAMSAERGIAPGKHERMISVTPEFAHKCVINRQVCEVTVKQLDKVTRAVIRLDELDFSDVDAGASPSLSRQFEMVLMAAGALDQSLVVGCKSLAMHLVRVVRGVR